MSVSPLPFPVPGENFIDRAGLARGVTKVEVGSDGTIQVSYLEGAPEYYYPSTKLGRKSAGAHQALCNIAFHPEINTMLEGGYYESAGQKHYPTNDDRADMYAETLRNIRAALYTEEWAEVYSESRNQELAPPLVEDKTAMMLGLVPDTRSAAERCQHGDSDVGQCIANRNHQLPHVFENENEGVRRRRRGW